MTFTIHHIARAACLAFAILGVISDTSNFTLVLDSISWFLLAVVADLNAIIGHMYMVMIEHLPATATESNRSSIEHLDAS